MPMRSVWLEIAGGRVRAGVAAVPDEKMPGAALGTEKANGCGPDPGVVVQGMPFQTIQSGRAGWSRWLWGVLGLGMAGLLAIALAPTARPDWPSRFDEHIVFPVVAKGKPEGRWRRPEVRAVPPGQTLRCPVVRDGWFSNVGREAEGNTGGAVSLKIKSYQEFALLDIDPVPLRGRTILAATLNVQLTTAAILRRVTVGTVAADWQEGTSARFRPQVGSSSYLWRRSPNVPWSFPGSGSFPGSDLSSVVLGNGNTQWWMADASPPDKDGWQRIAVEPRVMAARVADLSQGFVVYDDQGVEWSIVSGRFQLSPSANRYFRSQDAGAARAPWFEVVLGTVDQEPPAVCTGFRLDPQTSQLPAGEALIEWLTPADFGPAGTSGFLVDLDGQAVPRYLIPVAGSPGEVVELHLRDIPPGSRSSVLRVRAVDGAGNIGPAVDFPFERSTRVPLPLPAPAANLPPSRGSPPMLDGAAIAVIDTLDKVHPDTGKFIPAQTAEYSLLNPLWNAERREISLHAAGNEIIGFQVVLNGGTEPLTPQIAWESAGLKGAERFAASVLVKSAKGQLPDPLVPLADGTWRMPEDVAPADRRHRSLWCEMVVPRDLPPGEHRGRLTLQGHSGRVELDIRLNVWPFKLPDRLSFIPELNCYGLPKNEVDYYRLAHWHRTVLNRLPYSQRGQVDEGSAPSVARGELKWQRFDARFGPLLDGSAFRSLPRAGVPLETFYLPIHENWPAPINDHYNGSYWADLAFSDAYREAIEKGVAQFARHCADKGWTGTQFQMYLNNKLKYKKPDWKRGSSPWTLDEPASFQDFWAVRWFGQAFHAGLARSGLPNPPFVFRVDLSRPQFQRDVFDDVLDYVVVASAPGRTYRRLLLDNQRRCGQQLIEYGTGHPVEESNAQSAGWCIDAWSLGADGVLPWNSLGEPDSWKTADPLSLIYPPPGGKGEPVPSLRLKGFLRGQQLVEYLELWRRLTDQPRWAVGAEVRRRLELVGQAQGTGYTADEDAGQLSYEKLRPQHLEALRIAVGDSLAEHAGKLDSDPRGLTPERKSRRSRGGYVTVGEVPWREGTTNTSTR